MGDPSKLLTIAVGTVIVLIAAWAIVGFDSKSLKTTRHKDVAEVLLGQLRSGARQVDMANAADFQWDEMLVFGPYYPKNEICGKLKTPASQCSAAGISDVDESEFLLVFMRSGAICGAARVPRAIANFDETERCMAKPIRRSAAIFTVQRRPDVYLFCQ